MFSVNIDKLTNMTAAEQNSYQDLVETFMTEYGEECHTLAMVGGGVKAFKMAASIMEQGKKVLFIDGDMTSEIFLGKYKLGKNLKGITDYLKCDSEREKLLQELVCITNQDNMNIVFTGGYSDEQILLDDEEYAVKEMLQYYANDYDYIVVDSDIQGIIAKYCDGTMVIMDEGDYSELSSEHLVDELDEKGCRVLGIVICE